VVQYLELYVLTVNAHEQTLRYMHQCLAFAFMRQTRFREATAHFVKGAIDPRVAVSYFDELRPALFSEPPSDETDGSTTLGRAEGDSVEVEVWDGVREYMPDETSVDDISKLVHIYFSPFFPPVALARQHLVPPLPTSHHQSTCRQLNSPSSFSSHVSHNSRPCPTICNK
jgi:hypothetical protein